VAELLGFSAVTDNSLDAVSDRDFAVEFTAAASIIMLHLSRFCEELVLWSSDEFSFVEMDDAFSTGSSIMPQKKNPDVAELVRGKTGRVFGRLLSLLTLMKGLPLAYNKDMQEDKEALFDAVDTLERCLEVFTPMLGSLKIKTDRMRRAAGRGFTNATDLADYLVRKGLPFRSAHEAVGILVSYCIGRERMLEDLTREEMARETGLGHEYFGEDIYSSISLERCVEARGTWGGPGPEVVARAILQARERIKRS
jgi:argininosuccinate lyase